MDNANDKEPDVNDDLDTALRKLYTTTNPADLIMNEKLRVTARIGRRPVGRRIRTEKEA